MSVCHQCCCYGTYENAPCLCLCITVRLSLSPHLYTVVPWIMQRCLLDTHSVVSRISCLTTVLSFPLSSLYLWHCLLWLWSAVWHYASQSFTLHGLSRWLCALWPPGFSGTLFNALTPCDVVGNSRALSIPKQKSKYFNLWQIQIPKITLCPVSLSPCFHPAACVLRDKPSTGFSPSLSNSKA